MRTIKLKLQVVDYIKKDLDVKKEKKKLKFKKKKSEVTEKDVLKRLAWNILRDIDNKTYKAANKIIQSQYFNDYWVEILKNRSKHKDAAVYEEIFKTTFGAKRQATSERDLKDRFDLPSCITNTLNNKIVAEYKNDKKELYKGERSIRSYKKGYPIPVTKTSIKLKKEDDKFFIVWSLQQGEKIKFYVYLGKDNANYKHTLNMLIDKHIDYKLPMFKIDGKDIFLLLPVEDIIEEKKLDKNICVGVDLGIKIPAVCAVSTSNRMGKNNFIGDIQDFLRVRTQLQSRKKRLQKSLTLTSGGKGRKNKLKALNNIKDKERNFVKSYNHMISRRVIEFALKYNAGTIKLELLKGYSKNKSDNFILRNWSYFELQTMIEYKAKRFGIDVTYIDPYHTSQICSKCNNYEEGQREEQSKFKCKKCGYEVNADFNAARNIALSNKYVNSPEECEFHKKKLA